MICRSRKRTEFLRDRRGAAAVEFALVASIFIMVTLGLFEFGRVLYVRGKIAHAADAVTRLVLVTSSAYDENTASEEDLLKEAGDWLKDLDATRLSIDVGDENLDGIDYRTLTITYSMQLYIPGFGDGIQLAHFRRAPRL